MLVPSAAPLFPNRPRLYSSRRVWVGWVLPPSFGDARNQEIGRTYEICILDSNGDTTGDTVAGDRECSVCSDSRTGFVCTPRDRFGWAGYCRPHSATQEVARA